LSELSASWVGANPPTNTQVITPVNTDGMGTQQYGVDHVGSNNDPNPLHFRLTAAGLDVNDFVLGGVAPDTGKAYFFLADLDTGSIGNTGMVGALPVPAPIVGAGLPGVLFACAGLVGFARRRRQMAA
jgi:hypothetical protein